MEEPGAVMIIRGAEVTNRPFLWGPSWFLFLVDLELWPVCQVGKRGRELNIGGPSRTWYAESFGCTREVRNMFSVSCA